MKRILAWIGILAIMIAFAFLLYLTATGAPANTIMAVIFLMTIIPVILYGMLVILKLRDQKTEDEE